MLPVLLESLRPLNREGMEGAMEEVSEGVSTDGTREKLDADWDVSNKSRGLSISMCS